MAKHKFNPHCTVADIGTIFKSLFAKGATAKDPTAEIDRLVSEAIKEIDALTEKVALKAVKKPDCCKYLFVHISTNCQEIFFYECDDDGNMFMVLEGGKRLYLYPDLIEKKRIKVTRKVPNMALYRKPYCAKVIEELNRKGYKQLEGTEFQQFVINLSDKFNLSI